MTFSYSSYLVLFGSLRFFVLLIPEEKALVHRRNSDFPVRHIPTNVPVFILQYGKLFLYAEYFEYNICSDFGKGKGKKREKFRRRVFCTLSPVFLRA